MELVLENNYLIFENELLKQIKGVPIGMGCAPVFANIVLAQWEKL